ncbi:hypothetical protein CANCADRAFT_32229 [Tortispora caseinolytica NRRL Y-17796]|uniref:TRAM domain-containing protein n=1 Tax=Tortispora caseinolytica NRRL Y-17796 TaxID=767744 RepID=A0A1E4TAD2_9ASCO|nr:hypothetical protein CANCADRAFT_32229 [Tortispora caseinolytica NRRL Y-17796]
MSKLKSKKLRAQLDPASEENVLKSDIFKALATRGLTWDDVAVDMALLRPKRQKLTPEQLQLRAHKPIVSTSIIDLTSHGDGIAIYDHKATPRAPGIRRFEVLLIPSVLPGEQVSAKIRYTEQFWSRCDLLSVDSHFSPMRNNDLVQCKYFGQCSGCQFQMVPYPDQLILLRNTVKRAYETLCDLPKIPQILPTMPSPQQFMYRTKITPHFSKPKNDEPLKIGFNMAGGAPGEIDIEDCIIATQPIRDSMKQERLNIAANIDKYKNGATLLLRETYKLDDNGQFYPTTTTDNNETATTFVGKWRFEYFAGDFFQNNASILVDFTNYVKQNIGTNIKYLVDAYCGAGLFSVTCSDSAERILGIDISAPSIKSAKRNAELNNIKNATFIAGNAEAIFEPVKTETEPDLTAVIIDPPRKGCDTKFLNQLLEFSPKKIIYISCNVFTQARDLKYFLTHPSGAPYTVESVRGVDLFPQTRHVESIAVLSR